MDDRLRDALERAVQEVQQWPEWMRRAAERDEARYRWLSLADAPPPTCEPSA